MSRLYSRFLLLLLAFLTAAPLIAEKVSDLPLPTRYVNDFAHVLTPTGQQNLEDLSVQVHTKANAELVIVTIKTLDDGQSVEEFTSQLEEKWKLGKKGEDRSAILLLVLNPHKLRIETGYGLEGILNDARVGAIIDLAIPQAKAGDYDGAMMTELQGMSSVIAADAHVTLTPTVHTYHRQAAPPAGLGIGQIILGAGVVVLLLILVSTGHIGWAWVLLNLFLGGGGGGGGRGDDDRRGGGFGGGGFGGSGGGSSGGGGASRDF
jgi:uncharacterized protein